MLLFYCLLIDYNWNLLEKARYHFMYHALAKQQLLIEMIDNLVSTLQLRQFNVNEFNCKRSFEGKILYRNVNFVQFFSL